MNYLPVNVYTNTEFGDCTNNGITVTHKTKLVVECDTGHVSEEDIAKHNYIVLTPERILNHTFFVAKGETKHTMMGGNFVYTSDSRFRRMYPAPVAVHDRIE